MKMYLNEQQTAKLIELGFEKTNVRVDTIISTLNGIRQGTLTIINDFSIGELLSLLPQIIPQGDGYYINITHDSISWVIDYKQHGDTQYKYIVSDVELIDAIFAMILKLKEEEVI